MKHLNDNILCVLDVETTGRNPDRHDIIDIACIPVNHLMEVDKTKRWFDITMKPRHDIDLAEWEALKMEYARNTLTNDPGDQHSQKSKLNREWITNSILQGIDPDEGAELFVAWFEKLNLPPKKRIQILGHNVIFDIGFVKSWLGEQTYEYMFDPRSRDTMIISQFINDRADWKGEAFPFNKNNLGYLAKTLQCEERVAHNSLDDCLTTLEIYRKLVRKY